MLKYLKLDDVKVEYIRMWKLLKQNLMQQTLVWHRTSPKKVAAGIYIKKYDDYIVAQNVGLSLVTGSICAERAAVVAAVAKYPDLEKSDITFLMVLNEYGAIFPCGVCAEWLTKVNKDMKMITVQKGNFVECMISDVLKDEL